MLQKDDEGFEVVVFREILFDRGFELCWFLGVLLESRDLILVEGKAGSSDLDVLPRVGKESLCFRNHGGSKDQNVTLHEMADEFVDRSWASPASRFLVTLTIEFIESGVVSLELQSRKGLAGLAAIPADHLLDVAVIGHRVLSASCFLVAAAGIVLVADVVSIAKQQRLQIQSKGEFLDFGDIVIVFEQAMGLGFTNSSDNSTPVALRVMRVQTTTPVCFVGPG